MFNWRCKAFAVICRCLLVHCVSVPTKRWLAYNVKGTSIRTAHKKQTKKSKTRTSLVVCKRNRQQTPSEAYCVGDSQTNRATLAAAEVAAQKGITEELDIRQVCAKKVLNILCAFFASRNRQLHWKSLSFFKKFFFWFFGFCIALIAFVV